MLPLWVSAVWSGGRRGGCDALDALFCSGRLLTDTVVTCDEADESLDEESTRRSCGDLPGASAGLPGPRLGGEASEMIFIGRDAIRASGWYV